MILQSYSWAYVQTKLQFKKIHASQCSQQHYSRQPRHGSNLNVHLQRNGYRRYATVEYYSAIKKNEIMPFVATWMDLETITLSQKEKDDNHFYVESKKKCYK